MRSRLMVAPMFGLAMLLAACSAGAGSATKAPAAAAPAATPAAVVAAATTAAEGGYSKGGGATSGAAAVALATTGLGSVLADGAGKTLYVFTPDGTGASTCYDKCASAWPPLLSDAAPTLGTGLDAEDFAMAARTDGTKQLTFYGHPLYYFAGDQTAGDTKGQGVGEKWYVVDGTGAMVGATAAAPASSAAAAGGTAVALADTKLGKILVDAKGMTLYMFTADSAGKSACSGDCVGNWPPLLSDAAPTLGAGLDAEDFTTITRDDGGKQLAFYGMPLYLFAGDKAAGDTNGQGVGTKWYVLDSKGTVVK